MKRNASIADFFKPFQRPKQSRLNSQQSSNSTTSSAPTRVSQLPTPKPTPTVNTPSETHLTSSNPAPASSPPQDSSVPTTRVASPSSPRHNPSTTLDPPLRSDADAPSSGMARPDRTNTDASPEYARKGSASLSFSSLPPLSQTSTTSSRRVVKDGMEIVRTSDSEEESDSSLEDLSVLLASRKRSAPAERPPSRPSVSPPDNGRKDYNFRSHAKRPKKIEKLLPAPPKYKMSLAALAKQAGKERAAEEKTRETQAAMEELEKLLEDSAHGELTEENMVQAVGNADKAKKARDALERTGAFERVEVWRFFDTCRSTKPRPFPVASLPSQGWQTLLKDTATRESAVHSGFVQAGVARSALPDEVISWIVDEVCFGKKAALKFPCLRILESSTAQVRSLLGVSRIRQLFSQVGAKVSTTGSNDSMVNIAPTRVGEDDPRPAPPAGLEWLVRLLRQSAPHLAPEALEYGLEVLMRVNFDDSVLNDLELQALSSDAISAFLATFNTSFDTIARRTYTCLHEHPVLQSQLIASLPAHTPVECNFRRRLALCFFLQNSNAALTMPLTSRAFLESIFAGIFRTNPRFQISASTDYAAVSATADILDVAFEDGFSDLSFLTQLASIPRKPVLQDAEAKAVRQEARLLEDEFNAGIDKFVRLLDHVNGQVRNGHVEKMTQAVSKLTLERVKHRVEYGVRTRQTSTKDPFQEMFQSSGLMENWITRENGVESNEEGDDQSKERSGKRVSFAAAETNGEVSGDSGSATPNGNDTAEDKEPTLNGTAHIQQEEEEPGPNDASDDQNDPQPAP
ncbi:hypothetical protein HDK64DRAFT_31114 [Phyllosticta capitalensis]